MCVYTHTGHTLFALLILSLVINNKNLGICDRGMYLWYFAICKSARKNRTNMISPCEQKAKRCTNKNKVKIKEEYRELMVSERGRELNCMVMDGN